MQAELALRRETVSAGGRVGVGTRAGRVGNGRTTLHYPTHHIKREPAPCQKAHLAHAACGVGGRRTVLAAPQLGGARQFGLLQGLSSLGTQADTVLLQFLLDAPVAETRLARVHAALGETGVRQVAVLLQPLQQRVDLGGRVGTQGVAIVVGQMRGGRCAGIRTHIRPHIRIHIRPQISTHTDTYACTRISTRISPRISKRTRRPRTAPQQIQQLVAQLLAAVLTLGQPLQRAHLQRGGPGGGHWQLPR